jgi:hypothetical protein
MLKIVPEYKRHFKKMCEWYGTRKKELSISPNGTKARNFP